MRGGYSTSYQMKGIERRRLPNEFNDLQLVMYLREDEIKVRFALKNNFTSGNKINMWNKSSNTPIDVEQFRYALLRQSVSVTPQPDYMWQIIKY